MGCKCSRPGLREELIMPHRVSVAKKLKRTLAQTYSFCNFLPIKIDQRKSQLGPCPRKELA